MINPQTQSRGGESRLSDSLTGGRGSFPGRRFLLLLGASRMADNSERIAEIEAILRSGVKSYMNDGTQITHDFDALRKELNRLRQSDDALKGSRPKAVQFDLGGF
jgi:hypothetical protein